MTENVLDQDTNSEEKSNDNDDLISALVGPDKKFKSVEALAKGKLESDDYISTLEKEKADMRADMETLEKKANEGETVNTLLSEIRGLSTSSGESNQSSITEESLNEKIAEILTTRDEENSKNANYNRSNELLVNHFAGDPEKAKAHLNTKAQELGMSLDSIRDIGRTSPSAFSQLLALNEQAPQVTTSSTSTLQSSNVPSASGVRNAAYYSKLRKEMGSKYWSSDIQQQKMKDAQELGDRFFE